MLPNTPKHLCPQDWAAIEEQFSHSSPYNFAIIDDVVESATFHSIRKQIVGNWAWQRMNWQAEELYIRDFELAEVSAIAEELVANLPQVLAGTELVQHIAFWHQKNAGLYAHSDTGSISFNLWLTPDEHNLDPESGGLILYDVKRTERMQIHEFNAAPHSIEFLRDNTRGQSVRIPYRCNRAVLFDARTFHASDALNFRNLGPESTRINFALLFDDPQQFRARFAYYGSPRAEAPRSIE